MWARLRPRSRILEPAAGLRRSPSGGPTLVRLGLVLLVAIGASAAFTQLGSLRRTAEAPVTISSMVFEPGGGTKDRRERGFHLQYVYHVGAETFPAIAFRTWSDVDSHEPKVCYDPANPADHLLVDGDVECGAGAMFRQPG